MGPASYNVSRHEITLSYEFEYWYCLLLGFLQPLGQAIQASRASYQIIGWQALGQQIMQRTAVYRELLKKNVASSQAVLIDLLHEWLDFEQQLPPLLEGCQNSGVASEGLASWYHELSTLHRMFQDCLRWVFLHEILHAKTKWVTLRRYRRTYRISSVTELRPKDPSSPAKGRLVLTRKLLHESLTEWLTVELYRHLYGVPPQLEWRDIVCRISYPSWIIEYVVQALDSQWSPLTQTFPELLQRGLTNTLDLIRIIYFFDPQAVGLLKGMMETVGQNRDAFEKVAQACEQFCTPTPEREKDLQKAYRDLCRLFVWTYPDEIRRAIMLSLLEEDLLVDGTSANAL